MKPAALLILLFLSCPACLMADNAALAARAREQVGVTVSYNGGYQSIPYPNGDVPRETGVCTDVVIRAMRAFGLDLQKAVHEDMKAHFSKYPRRTTSPATWLHGTCPIVFPTLASFPTGKRRKARR